MEILLKMGRFYAACASHAVRAYAWKVSPGLWPDSLGAFLALLVPYFALTAVYATLTHLWPIIPGTLVVFGIGFVVNRLFDVSYRLLFGSFLVWFVAALVKIVLLLTNAGPYIQIGLYLLQTAVFLNVMVRAIAWEKANIPTS